MPKSSKSCPSSKYPRSEWLKSAAICLSIMVAAAARADLAFEREIYINSKTTPAVSNITGSSQAIEMQEAQVDINVSAATEGSSLITLTTNAQFHMHNSTKETVLLTMGFPVSDSSYSAFQLIDFRVTSGGEPRSVFQRVTGYPRHREHIWVSGPETDPRILPDANDPPGVFGDENWIDRNDGSSVLQDSPDGSNRGVASANKMVWRELFTPNEVRLIVVTYSLNLPTQSKKSEKMRKVSNEKGISREEANNCPVAFLNKLAPGDYYFFDYYLVTGASWKGPIGKEEIRLHLPPGWVNATLSSWPEKTTTREDLMVYRLEREEPRDNIYWAVSANAVHAAR